MKDQEKINYLENEQEADVQEILRLKEEMDELKTENESLKWANKEMIVTIESADYLKQIILSEDKRIGLGQNVKAAEELIKLIGHISLKGLIEATKYQNIERLIGLGQIFNAIVINLSSALSEMDDDDDRFNEFRWETRELSKGLRLAWKNFYDPYSSLMFHLEGIEQNVKE